MPRESTKKSGVRAVVAGGAGFIGSNLCRALIESEATVYAIDNLITGRELNLASLLDNERFHFIKIDITDKSFPAWGAEIKPTHIYHLASPTGVPNIQRFGEEMLLTASVGTRHILELARANKSRVLFTSTAEIYGQPEVFPQTESYHGNVNPVGPRSAYEEGKRFAESLTMMYVRKYGVDARIVRVFNTYGPAMSLDDQRVIPQFLRGILTGGPLTIYGDGSQTRTLLYVDDLVEGLFIAMEKGIAGEVYNIGGSAPLSIKALAELLLALTNRSNGIIHLPHFIEDHRDRLPAVTKIMTLGWREHTTLEEGLRRTIAAASREANNTPSASAHLSA